MNRYFWAFLASEVSFYLFIFRSLFFVNAFSMVDSEPYMKYFRPHLFTLSSPSSFLYSFMNSISWNSPERVFTVLPFILGTLLFYLFAKSLKVSEWKAWLFSFVYMLNPGTVLIFNMGDAPGILMVYSIFPLVMLLGFRLSNSMKLYDAILLSGSIILATFFFYQAFLLVWPYLLVLIILSKNRLKLFALFLFADFLAFLSNINFEIMIYELVVPTLSVHPVENIPYFVKEIYYVALYLGVYGIGLFLLKPKKEAMAFLSLALIMLTAWPLIFYQLPSLPLINAIILTFTTFEQKFVLLINGLVIMSFIFLKRWEIPLAVVVIALLSIVNIPFISVGIEKQGTVYALLTFNAKHHEVSNGFFEVEEFLYNDSSFYYVGVPQHYLNPSNLTLEYEIVDLIPNVIPINTTNSSALAEQGIKYLITLSKLNYHPGLEEVFNADGFYIYRVEEFKSVAFSPSGEPLNVTVMPNKVVVYGNSSLAIVKIPYNKFWSNALNYSGYLAIPMKDGVGVSVNQAYYINEYLLIIDFIVILGVIFYIVWGRK